MSARKIILFGFRVIALALGLAISFLIGTFISGLGRGIAPAGAAAVPAPAAAQANPNDLILLLFLASLIQAAVVAYVVTQARWSGWKLTGAVFLLLLNTFVQGGIESAIYLRGRWTFNLGAQLPVSGLIIGLLFAPFAVWVLGGFRPARRLEGAGNGDVSGGQYGVRLAALAVAFLAVYYLCGYFIAWQSPALRQFYSGSTELKSFWGQLAGTWSSTPWMIPIQAGRGLLWVVLTLPAIRMLRGGRRSAAFGAALMYAALDGSAMLILPNPLMPPAVAHRHLVELAVSGLAFGALAGWTMGRRDSNSRELLPAKAV